MALQVDILKNLDFFDLDVRLDCDDGSITAIVGPSGAGKTTLIRIVAGLDRPDQGRVSMNGFAWVDTDTNVFLPPQRRKLGLVFQDYALFPHLTVRKNVCFAAEDDDRVCELLDMFGVRRLENKRPAEISGGERQRVAFCQALARNPSLLLLDEPFSALDARTRECLRSLLREMKTELGIPILHVTHDLEEAGYLGDSILAVEDGKLAPDWLHGQYRYVAPAQVFEPVYPS